ncbi:MAG: hypothetical protein MUC50_07285 [Myxococcota bacterium]|nr:hypothetical protein [Myxococcota bacterium]
MWQLYDRYYALASPETFRSDLLAKSHVFLMRDDQDNALRGFSTVLCHAAQVDGRRFYCIYSGDTIVAREYWGQTALQTAFLKFMVRCKLAHPFTKVYWFLISKGYKTYLLLSRNFPVYWPRHDKPMPAWEKRVIDVLGQERFGQEYLSECGLIRHEVCPGKLRETVAPIDDELRLGYPDIDYFVRANPGHIQGDELCCLGLVSPVQWVFYLQRLARKQLRRVLRLSSSKREKRRLTAQSVQP